MKREISANLRNSKFQFLSNIARGLKALLLLSLFSSSFAYAGQLTLTWNDNSDNEDGFKIERSLDGSNYSQIGTVGPNVVTYVDSTVVDDQSYTYRVRAYNVHGDSGYSNTASGMNESPNSTPTITTPSDQNIFENESATGIAFTISDSETNAGDLDVTASSSNTSLLANNGIVLSGAGANRSVSLTPIADAYGSTTVTLTVSDGEDSASIAFDLFVQSVTDPTITAISNQSINRGSSFPTIAFTIGDQESSASDLSLSVNSSNASLLPTSNISISGSGANRTLTATPVTNAIGSSTITVTVSDGTGSSSSVFDLSVYSAPIVLAQPVDTATMVGDSTLISASIEAYPSPTYQWYFNGVPISGANGSQISIAETAFSNEGAYKVVATNAHGSVTSAEIDLDVDQIILAPTGLQVVAGSP